MRGIELWLGSLRSRPLGTVAALVVQYLGFVSACVFLLLLWLTRVPLRELDRSTGWDVRRRLIDAIARLSPG